MLKPKKSKEEGTEEPQEINPTTDATKSDSKSSEPLFNFLELEEPTITWLFQNFSMKGLPNYVNEAIVNWGMYPKS